MGVKIRLTPAQWRGLDILARPGAVAAGVRRSFRWAVSDATGGEIGTIAAESLLALRVAGYVEMFNGGAHPLDFRQRITPEGRQAAAAHGGGEGEQHA